MLGNLFEVLADRYKERAYALPAKSYSKKNRNKTPEFDIFSPALVAHLYLSIENINIVRRGMISLYGQAYFIFPESREFCYLNVCDEYHMIAGQKEILMESLGDRKSTRLNSSHLVISYAVFCLKKKKKN